MDDRVRRISRSYEVRGMLTSITSHDDPSPGQGSVLNEAAFAYNDFGQLIEERQAHDGLADSNTPAVGLAYEDGSDPTTQTRLTHLTYPNQRELHQLYTDPGDTEGISHMLGRVSALAHESTRGTDDANVIVAMTHLGHSSVVRKAYPEPAVRLDHWGGTSGSYDGFDRFGRIVGQRWDRYDSLGDHEQDVIHISHAYDRAGNRLHARRHVHQSHSEVYEYDELHRLVGFSSGLINDNQDGIEPFWQAGRGEQAWNLDLLGNQLGVSDKQTADYFQNTPNKANEYTHRQVQAGETKPPFADDDFTADTSSNWSMPGSGDAFDINVTTANRLTVTTVAQDTIDGTQEPEAQTILLLGEAMGPIQGGVTVQFPATASAGQAGLVFGYRDGGDYWLRVLDLDEQQIRIYHVLNGTKSLMDSEPYSVTAGGDLVLTAPSKRNSLWSPGAHDLASGGGYPSGKVGLYTNVADTQFDDYALYDDAQHRSLTDRWRSHSGQARIDATTDRLELSADGPATSGAPVLLRSVRASGFEATFPVRRVGSGSEHQLAFVFEARDQDHYNYLTLHHTDTPTAPVGFEVTDGKLPVQVTGTSTDANMPNLGSSDVLWVRVRSDGSTLSVRAATSEAGLATASDAYSTTDFDFAGGKLGFKAMDLTVSIDELTLNRWNDSTSSYSITEHVETFEVDGSGYREEQLEHDAAGNLTYDGVHAYRYDAWNRLTDVAPAYRDGYDTLHTGSVIQTNHYDGDGRRIVKQVTHSAYLNATYHYYYSGQSNIEVRNGSDLVLKQYVWGTRYIDELVQVSVNADPTDGDEADIHHFALHNANFNVMGLIDDAGDVVERYEYSPYGQRTVYISAGTAPISHSQRWQVDNQLQPYALNPIGHQGLRHDPETGLVYNRARMLHVSLGRFTQRDPLGYVDGMSLYATYHILHGRLDPFGLECGECRPGAVEWLGPARYPRTTVDRKPGDFERNMASLGRIVAAANHLKGLSPHDIAKGAADDVWKFIEEGIGRITNDKLRKELWGFLKDETGFKVPDRDFFDFAGRAVEKFNEAFKARSFYQWVEVDYRVCESCCDEDPSLGEWSEDRTAQVQVFDNQTGNTFSIVAGNQYLPTAAQIEHAQERIRNQVRRESREARQ